MHRGPWRKLSGNQLSYHWFKNFTWPIWGDKGCGENRPECICPRGLFLQDPACSFVGGKTPWPHWGEKWGMQPPVPPAGEWQWGTGGGRGTRGNFRLTEQKQSLRLFFSKYPDVTVPSLWVSLWDISVAFGDQMSIRRSWGSDWHRPIQETLLCELMSSDTASLRPTALTTGFSNRHTFVWLHCLTW